MSDLKALQDEVMRRVGRNLLLFQEVERLMKFLILHTRFETGPMGISSAMAERQTAIQKKTMGQVREQFFDEMYAEKNEFEPDSETTKIRFRSTFKLSALDKAQVQRDKDLFLEMNNERNDLVHHFLSNWTLTSIESIQAATEHLDSQRQRTLPLHACLKSMVYDLRQHTQTIFEFLNSPEGQHQFELDLLRQSGIVAILCTAAHQLARNDGWTMLEAAANILVKEADEDLVSIKKRYGYRSLKALVVATELFDISDEKTLGGGFRTIFRIKSETPQ